MLNSINSFNSVSYSSQVGSVGTENTNAAQAKGVEINYNPQDELVMDPQVVNMPSIHAGKGTLEGDNVQFVRKEQLEPNKEGQYVYTPGTREFVSSVTMATVQKTIDAMSEKFGKIEWAFGGDKIGLASDAGEDFNAYYSRNDASLNFFHGLDPVTNQMVFSGSSGEVVSHEVGHAILDAQRPGYLSTWQADTNGFHEAFGDLTGLFMATQSDEVCAMAAKETGGDLHKPNCLAASGELLGRAINNSYGKNVTGGDYVRNYINDFKWQAPRTVPRNPSGTDPLTTEMHSWSRIFTGAQYDVMAGIVEKKMGEGMDAAAAIKAAGNESMTLLAEAVKMAPQRDVTYRDLALLMLKADANNGGEYHDIVLNTMMDRNILFEGDDTPSDMSMASMVPSREMTITLDGAEFGKFAGAEVTGTVPGGFNAMEGSPADGLAQDMKQLIQNGCILYTEPNQTVEKKDLFDKNGHPYIGVVRWTDGKMVIERNMMIG